MDTCHQDWARYNRLRTQSRLALVSIFIPIGVEEYLRGFIANSGVLRSLVSVLFLAWFVVAIILAERANAFRCPRCQKKFSRNWWQTNGLLFARHCYYCSLQRDAQILSRES